MKTTILLVLDSIKDVKEYFIISTVVVVIKLLIYIKKTAKLDFKVMITNAGITMLLGMLFGWVSSKAPIADWIPFAITFVAGWVGAKIDVYIYKVLDIGVSLFKSKTEDIGNGED